MTRNLTGVAQAGPIKQQYLILENVKDNAEVLSEKMEMVNMSEKPAFKRRLSPENLKTHRTTKTQRETMPPNSIRFNNLKHDINYDDPNNPRKGFRCKLESCGLPTTVYCELCKVHLCFVTGKNGRNCFKHFHNLSES